MKIKSLIVFLLVILQVQIASAQDLKSFLKNCVWGVIGGASVGVISLAFTDKPSESWNNVTKGASLGLYVGMAYGLSQINNTPTEDQHPDFTIIPDLHEGKLNGAHIVGTVLNF